MKRTYPLFLIDRDRLGDYPLDYISCFDKEVGFIAKVIVEKDRAILDDYVKKALIDTEFEHRYIVKYLNTGRTVLLEIVDFLYKFEWSTDRKNRVKTLLNKAVKKYLATTFLIEPNGSDFSIDNQIKAQELTLKRTKQHWADLVERGNQEEAQYTYEVNEVILQSLKRLKKLYELS